MKVMVWNDYLASLAEKWAEGCKYGHGHPTHNFSIKPGQNLYKATASIYNIKNGMRMWYIEKTDYNYDTLNCTKGKMCGHYTQMVWADSEQVGCGSHRCPSFNYFVCNYWPRGNWLNKKPYEKGPACSKCDGGAGWCKDGLCNWKCSKRGEDCSCAAVCYNCATLDKKTCRCKCADGWGGADCKERCEDKDAKCNAGWYEDWCDRDYVREKCLVMCNRCTPDENAVADKCPPVKGSGQETPLGALTNSSESSDASTSKLTTSTMMTTMILLMTMIVLAISHHSAL